MNFSLITSCEAFPMNSETKKFIRNTYIVYIFEFQILNIYLTFEPLLLATIWNLYDVANLES